jgi:hypothetical protein
MTGDHSTTTLQEADISDARSLLDQLLGDSRLYTKSQDYKDLLDFVVRLRNFAPFNAMLLQVQKPGLSYAASASDWRERFGRCPKEGARPLIILWPFGPVALVYDVLDTVGKDLPEDVASFTSAGEMNDTQYSVFTKLLAKKNIKWNEFDGGDNKAGSIQVVHRASKTEDITQYQININRNHSKSVQFTTIAHELGHLYLGHLGSDKKLKVPKRAAMTKKQVELEAESVAYLVCKRNGITAKSETYLTNFVDKNTTVEQLDLYQVMRAAGQVETILGMIYHTKYDKPSTGTA